MNRAVIFDMDGTLLNTLYDLKESVNYALKEFNFPIRSIDEVRNFVGNGVDLLFERALPENIDIYLRQKVVECFKMYYRENMYNHTAPYDGIIELLTSLKSKNIKTGVVSNKFDKAVKELACKYFNGLVDIAVGQSETIQPKPKPDGVLKCIRELQCTMSDDIVYVGDSDVDVKTGRNANIKVVGVTWGFRDRDNLSGADFIVDTSDELLQVLLSL